MRFAIVTETFPPEINGVALTVQSLATQLCGLGHAVTVVRPRQAGERDADGETEVLVASSALPRYPGLRFGWPAGRRLLRRWTAARPRAVYIATEGPLGLSALRVARRLGIPVLTGFHTRFDAYLGHYGAAWLAPVASAWLRRFHNRAQATLVPTRALRDELRACGFENARVLARGVDTERFAPTRRSERLRRKWRLMPGGLAVVHVGRLAAEKNLDLLVDAFEAIRERRIEAKLILVGDGPLRAELRARIPDAVFCGTQTGEQLATHYASGDLFVFPSLSETYGNVVPESLASGVPVAAFAQGAALEHVRDGRNGCAVPPGERAAFVRACVALAMDRSLEGPMREAATASVARLDPSRVAMDFVALVDELAEASDCVAFSRMRTAAGERSVKLVHYRPFANESEWCRRANAGCARDGVRACFRLVSRLGDGVAWYALMGGLVVFGGARGAAAALHLAATGVVSLVLYTALKRWTRRPRPCAADARIRAWIAPLDEFSFPSGHTLHAVAFSYVAIAYFPALAWLLVPFAASIALSRVLLGLHYPSDVLAALGIGLVLGETSLRVGAPLAAIA